MDQPSSQLTPGVYRHFKGGLYKVLGVAEDTETHAQSVVYVPNAGEYAGKLRLRPLAMFLENVRRPEIDYEGPRFALVTARDFLGNLNL